MNRELKFRAYDKGTNKWLCGYESIGGFDIMGECILFGEWGKALPVMERWDDVIIMQFTGLYDIQQNPIYEGDIVEVFHGHPGWISTPFIVVFQAAAFALKKPELVASTSFAMYFNDCINNGVFSEDGDESKLFKVIGNIHEHPHLLNP
jgi:uncharacterized phage protein (TIGR01671 family)